MASGVESQFHEEGLKELACLMIAFFKYPKVIYTEEGKYLFPAIPEDRTRSNKQVGGGLIASEC